MKSTGISPETLLEWLLSKRQEIASGDETVEKREPYAPLVER